MLPDNHCEVITLSDDDGAENDNDEQHLSQRNNINISPYQHSQLRQQMRDRLKRANNEMQMAKHQRFTPQATGGGVSLSIINERPLDMKKLLTTNRSLIPTHQLPPTPSQPPLTVKDHLIMFFQQQHKVHLQLEKKAKTSTVRNENGLPAPFKNKITVQGLKRPIPEWPAQYNGPPSRTTILMNG
ncbi:hypothetical protein GPALN_012000 [Globodera pallida]|nr:hypothetical protein GPALN_012000 [Globodera pallida]